MWPSYKRSVAQRHRVSLAHVWESARIAGKHLARSPSKTLTSISALLFMLSFGPLYAGELQDGLAAYRSKDYAQAMLLLQPLAEQGEPVAQFTLGQMYRRGRGFVPSLPEALPLLQQAADANYPPAQIALGEMYESGEGVAKNFEAAEQWFEKAANSGNAKAQLHLGAHYIRIDPGRDFAKAATWLKLAAQQNEAEAQYFLARLLLDGSGVEQDRAEAMVWFFRAGAQGHAPSQRFLHRLKQADTPDRGLLLRDLRRQLSAGVATLEAVASDPAYAFDKMHSVKTGSGFVAEWRYLNALRGPKGEVVYYQRVGACCAFDSAAVESGKGYLDQYTLIYEGMDKHATIYLDMFEPGMPQAPLGFSFVHEAAAE